MAKSDSTRRSPDRNPGILSRDEQATEHYLLVTDRPHAMVSLFDDEVRRTMHPAAAIELAVALIHATKGRFKGIVGPISGGF